ncbi:MAG: zinc-ribbon domain-containing protein [Planctomycetaceae bacterium]|nr:zinc-ribbon domain-containing protein [Planctomycetaceae bacterium]
MTIAFSCPQCNKKYKVDDDSAGKRTTCPNCKTALTVPAAASVTPPTPPPSVFIEPALPDNPFTGNQSDSDNKPVSVSPDNPFAGSQSSPDNEPENDLLRDPRFFTGNQSSPDNQPIPSPADNPFDSPDTASGVISPPPVPAPIPSDVPAAMPSQDFMTSLFAMMAAANQKPEHRVDYDTSLYEYRCVLGPPSIFRYEGIEMERARKLALTELERILGNLPGPPWWEFVEERNIKVVVKPKPPSVGCLALLFPGLGTAAKMTQAVTKQAGQLTGSEDLGADTEMLNVWVYKRRKQQ